MKTHIMLCLGLVSTYMHIFRDFLIFDEKREIKQICVKEQNLTRYKNDYV